MDRDTFCKRFFISEELYEAVHIALYRYDPMGVAHLAPDEYDMEVVAICAHLDKRLYRTDKNHVKGIAAEEVAEIVKKVFGDFFGSEYVTEDALTVASCESAAQDILEALLQEEENERALSQ